MVNNLIDLTFLRPKDSTRTFEMGVAPHGAAGQTVGRGLRPSTRGWAAVGALTLLLLGWGAEGAVANLIDLHAPEAGITDPLAGVEPLDRDCVEGQVDLNVDSAEEIASALNISSRPTVDRIIAGRPWLKSADVISVPGVPPSALERLVRDACATPTTLPVATPLACRTGSAAVDLQAATREEMVAGLKLPRSVADAIVAARPIPQDLHQIAAPRVPGLSDPKIDTLLEDGRVCVTPAAFTFTEKKLEKTWKWASEEHGAVVADASDASYAVIVPPGVVDGPTGAWGRVTILPDTLPRADLHIFGSWEREVATRLPDVADPAYARPAVLHEADDGAAFSWGHSVVREQHGTLVAALGSLSEVTSLDLSPLCLGSFDNGSPYCAATSPRDTSLLEILRNAGEYSGRYVAALPKPGPCGNNRNGIIAAGGVPYSIGCYFEGATNDKATWRIANNSGLETAGGLFTVFGTVANREALGNHAYSLEGTEVDDNLYGLVGKPAAKFLAEHGTLLPSTSVAIVKPRGSGPSVFRHALPLTAHGAWWALFNVLDVVDAGFTLTGTSDYYQVGILKCFQEVAGSGGNLNPKLIMECAEPQVQAYLDGFTAAAEANGNTKLATRLASLGTVLKKVTLIPAGFDWGASFINQLGGAAFKGDEVLLLDYLPPAPPSSASVGGLAGDGSFMARTSAGKGFLVDPYSGTAAEIKTGGDFLCYAKSRLVIDLVDLYTDGSSVFINLASPVEIEDQPAPACPTPSTVWDYSEPPAGNTPFNVILKGEDDGGVDSAWLINSRGEIQTIPNGGIYECLTFSNAVIWNVPLAKINAWKKVGTAPASCG